MCGVRQPHLDRSARFDEQADVAPQDDPMLRGRTRLRTESVSRTAAPPATKAPVADSSLDLLQPGLGRRARRNGGLAAGDHGRLPHPRLRSIGFVDELDPVGTAGETRSSAREKLTSAVALRNSRRRRANSRPGIGRRQLLDLGARAAMLRKLSCARSAVTMRFQLCDERGTRSSSLVPSSTCSMIMARSVAGIFSAACRICSNPASCASSVLLHLGLDGERVLPLRSAVRLLPVVRHSWP